jgi:hypothetical protein
MGPPYDDLDPRRVSHWAGFSPVSASHRSRPLQELTPRHLEDPYVVVPHGRGVPVRQRIATVDNNIGVDVNGPTIGDDRNYRGAGVRAPN